MLYFSHEKIMIPLFKKTLRSCKKNGEIKPLQAVTTLKFYGTSNLLCEWPKTSGFIVCIYLIINRVALKFDSPSSSVAFNGGLNNMH